MTPIRIDAADDDDDEGEDEDFLAHADLRLVDRRHQHAGKPGEHRANAEHGCEQQPDIDAERADHLAVRGAGADQHAESGPRDQPVQAECDETADDDDEHAVAWIDDAERQCERRIEKVGQRNRHACRPPDQPHGLVEEQDKAKRRQHLVHMATCIERTQRDDLEHESVTRK